jgi:hypothetical protein
MEPFLVLFCDAAKCACLALCYPQISSLATVNGKWVAASSDAGGVRIFLRNTNQLVRVEEPTRESTLRIPGENRAAARLMRYSTARIECAETYSC